MLHTRREDQGGSRRSERLSKESLHLRRAKACVRRDGSHGVSVDRVVSRDGQPNVSVGHDDVLSLPQDNESGPSRACERLHRRSSSGNKSHGYYPLDYGDFLFLFRLGVQPLPDGRLDVLQRLFECCSLRVAASKGRATYGKALLRVRVSFRSPMADASITSARGGAPSGRSPDGGPREARTEPPQHATRTPPGQRPRSTPRLPPAGHAQGRRGLDRADGRMASVTDRPAPRALAASLRRPGAPARSSGLCGLQRGLHPVQRRDPLRRRGVRVVDEAV